MTDALDTRGATGSVQPVDFTSNSFTKMLKAGVIKRTDSGMQIRLKDIHDKLRADGTCWNRRDMQSEKTQANIAALVKHIGKGGQVPPIEVQARNGGGVEKVDGYCRTEAFRSMDASGEGDVWVSIVPFKGDDLDALARIETSNHDSKLTPIEQLDLYVSIREELKAMGEKGTLQQIADRVDCSRQYVDQILKLEALDDEGRALVESGKAKVADAIKAVRSNKDNASGATAALKKAAAPKPVLPATPILGDMYGLLGGLRASLGKAATTAVGEFLKGERKGCDRVEIEVGELGRLMALLAEGERQTEAKLAKAKAKADANSQEEMAHDDLKQNDTGDRFGDMPDLGGDDEPDLGDDSDKPLDEPKRPDDCPDLSFL